MSVAAARLELSDASIRRWTTLAPALLIAAIMLVTLDILVRWLG